MQEKGSKFQNKLKQEQKVTKTLRDMEHMLFERLGKLGLFSLKTAPKALNHSLIKLKLSRQQTSIFHGAAQWEDKRQAASTKDIPSAYWGEIST